MTLSEQDRLPIQLKGEWRFFWHQLVNPDQLRDALKNPPNYLAVPGGWNDLQDPIDGQRLGAFGWGTYLLQVNGLTDIKDLGITMAFASSNYKLWVLNTPDPSQILLTLENGLVGTDANTSVSQHDPRLGRFKDADQSHSVFVLIQVSNFSWIHGGLFNEPILGNFAALQRDLESTKTISHLLLGILLILGLYNLSLFAHRREDFGSFFLAIFCFAAAVIYARSTPNLFYSVAEVSERNHWIIRSLYFVANPLMVASFNSFVRSNFPKQSFRWFEKLCWIWTLGIAVPLVFFQSQVPVILFRVYQYAGLILPQVILVQMIRAAWQKEEGALISVLGTGLLIGGFTNDYLILYKLREGVFILPLGVAVFVLLQSQIVAIRFTKAFHHSEKLGRDLQREVDRQTRDIKSILSHIKQGIFTLVPPFKQAGEQYSDYLVKLLGKVDIKGQAIGQLLLNDSDLTADSKSQLESALDAILGEPDIAFEMNEGNLVREIHYHDRATSRSKIFEVDWNPITSKLNLVENILVSLRDVSEERRFQSIAEQREKDLHILIELVQIPEEKFQRFLAKSMEYLAENRDIILSKDKSRSEILKRLFMNMHTIKGSARSYSLKEISSSVHEVEQHYATLQRNEIEWNQERLLSDLDAISKVLNTYQSVGKERLGWNIQEKFIKIPRARFEKNLNSLVSIDKSPMNAAQRYQFEKVTNDLSAACFESISVIIAEASRGLDSIARDLKKEIPDIMIPECPTLLLDKGTEFLFNVLMHLFRNSLDHGIEVPQIRISKGKKTKGTITISIHVRAEGLVLDLRDDGNGLDLIAIRAKALERGIISPDLAYSDLQIAGLIFLPGFSTKTAVSEISGRGVGLNAVQTYCDEVGATIGIKIDCETQDQKSVPFHFELVIPRHLVFQNGEALESRPMAS